MMEILQHPATPWLVGMFVSLGVGHFVVGRFHATLWKALGAPVEKPFSDVEFKPVPGWLTGLAERLFFTFIVASDVSGTAVAMIAWIALKLTINWNRPGMKLEGEQSDVIRARYGFVAAVVGLLSMLFALAGGLICRLGFPAWVMAL